LHYMMIERATLRLTHPSFAEYQSFPVPLGAVFLTAAERWCLAQILAQGGEIDWHPLDHAPDHEVVPHQTAPALCAVFRAPLLHCDRDRLGPSVDNWNRTGGYERQDHQAPFCQLVFRVANPAQHRENRQIGFVLKDAVEATIERALSAIEDHAKSPQAFRKLADANTRRITAEPNWLEFVNSHVHSHKKSDRKCRRATDLTTDNFIRCLEQQGARCNISWILFGDGKWAPSLDRLDDLLGHNVDPKNVEFIIRMFNTQIKFDRMLLLQVRLVQQVHPPAPYQRNLIVTELRALTELA
jgi:hypothetical protein